MDKSIKTISRTAGGVIALSLALGLSRGAVSQWKRVPAERVAGVERLTGIPREELRLDIFAKTPAKIHTHPMVAEIASLGRSY
ncbi:MAG: hypothetical protein AWT59_3362 [Candidatus Gallionella acididurans]|uniref:CI repressor n=1 Tax=Candidatus Gallionella acididurans TaxID=1796491 RepID=A0A139BNY3_9PROT|nr:MAG: hypothetical protein AWT59_3362 [Candidatus Gallionella acididurans]